MTELARQVLRVSEFTDLKQGLTVNPGIFKGGTRTNVVADLAEADVDVRIVRARDGEMLATGKLGGAIEAGFELKQNKKI